jgi:hypothetical protein
VVSGQWKEEHPVGPERDGYEQSASKFVRLLVAVNSENQLIIVARGSAVQTQGWCILEAKERYRTQRKLRSHDGQGRVIRFLVTHGSLRLDGCGRDWVSASGVTSKQRRAFGFTLDVA